MKRFELAAQAPPRGVDDIAEVRGSGLLAQAVAAAAAHAATSEPAVNVTTGEVLD
jgi:hypothetical protein